MFQDNYLSILSLTFTINIIWLMREMSKVCHPSCQAICQLDFTLFIMVLGYPLNTLPYPLENHQVTHLVLIYLD